MSKLLPVKYHRINYPSHIKPIICEIAGNFDIEELSVNNNYSLHTEYSFGPRKFNSKIIKDLVNITSNQKNNIPQLWFNEEWANNFFTFIERLIGSNIHPKVLEIHPPFNDYCKSFDRFLEIYKVFCIGFKSKYYETEILIENRYGTLNKGGNFLISSCSDVLEFACLLFNSNIDLKIVLDYPQLFSAETDMDNIELEKIIDFNIELKKYKEKIGGFHLWGKRKDKNGEWAAHAGNFDTFFNKGYYPEDQVLQPNYEQLKHDFLHSVFSTFDDNVARYFVPEVNSGTSDLHSIVIDMEREGFVFI